MRKDRRKKRKAGLRAAIPEHPVLLSMIAAAGLTMFVISARILSFVLPLPPGDEPYPAKGVDVSVYQKEVDWPGMEREGYSFAFIKATEGSSHVDRDFDKNWEGIAGTGMKAGAYHFLSYDSSGADQAENFIETVEGRTGMLPPAVDVEFYGKYLDRHPSKERVYSILDTFMREVGDEYGMKPVIYTNVYVYDMYFRGRYQDHPVWISDPCVHDRLPDGRRWDFCQYTFEGRSDSVAGGRKDVDLNVFSGSKWDLLFY